MKIIENEKKIVEYKLVKTFKDFKNSKNLFYEFIKTKDKNFRLSKETYLSKFLRKILNSKKKSDLANIKDAINVHNIYEKIFQK